MTLRAMYRSCQKCGRIHDIRDVCRANTRPSAPKTRDQELRSTQRWQDKSREIRDASRWLCAICEEEGIFNYNKLEVHHITKLRDDEEGLLDNYNLICLCKAHHEQADAGEIDAEHLRELARRREEGR